MNINATIFGQFISFILFVLFCMKFIWPPIIKLIKKRQKKVYNSLLLVKKQKNKLLIINKKIFNKIKNAKLKYKTILKQAYEKKKDIINKSIKIALLKKNKIINSGSEELLIKLNKEKKKLQEHSVFLIIQVLKKIFHKKLNQDYLNFIINKFKKDFKGF